MNKKPRIRQLLKIYHKAKRVNNQHKLCLAFPKDGCDLRVMVAFEKYLMPQETFVYAQRTAKKLRAKLLIPES